MNLFNLFIRYIKPCYQMDQQICDIKIKKKTEEDMDQEIR